MKYHEKDRLSELPESLIIDILRFLPLTDVVRTTVLSKHWKNLGTTIPWLDFDERKMKNKDKFREFVYGALGSWRGTKILRFNIVILDSEVYDSLSNDDIDRWVRFSVEKDVEDLELLLTTTLVDGVAEKLYTVAQDVYSCSSLKELCLSNCNVQIHGNVHWDQLKSLTIFGGCLSEEAMNKVLCGSPRLEYLSLVSEVLENKNENLNIRSSSLKRLSIDNFSMTGMEDTELRISTPNLEYLRISGDGYSKCLLMNNMPSLRVADLDFSRVPQNVVGEMLTKILPVIKHVKLVRLSDLCIKALGAMKEKCMLPSFPNAHHLHLQVRWEEYEQIVGVLVMFPQLRTLLLCTNYGRRSKEAKISFKLDKNAERWLKFDINFPNLFLPELRRVCVTCAKGDESILPLIYILLKYAINLENMTFRDQEGGMKLLKKMERSSPNEELIFDHTNFFLQ